MKLPPGEVNISLYQLCVCVWLCAPVPVFLPFPVCSLIFPFQLEGTVGVTHLHLNKNTFFRFVHAIEYTQKRFIAFYVFQVCFCPHSPLHRRCSRLYFPLPVVSQSKPRFRTLLGESYISQPICWTRVERRVETAGLGAALSLAQSVSRGHAGALLTESHAAVGRAAAQRFCLFADGEDGAVLVERTHCGARTSAGVKKPTWWRGWRATAAVPCFMYVDVTDHSVRTNI